MNLKLSHSFIFVNNQEEALRFYTEKLGFLEKANIPLGSNKRWITVSPPDQKDIEIVLMKAMEGPVLSKQHAEIVNNLVKEGVFGWCIMSCDNINLTYNDLKAKGVKFLSEPSPTPSGMSANFEDPSGNWISLIEKRKN